MVLDLLIMFLVAFLLNIIYIYMYKNYTFDFQYDFNNFIKSYIDVILICFFGWMLGCIVIFLANLDKDIINKNIGLFLKVNFSIIIFFG